MSGGFTEENIADGEANPTLGPAYFAARDFVGRVMVNFEEEHIKPLADAVTKAVTDQITEKVWDAFRDGLLTDTEYNAQGHIWHLVDDTVKALLSGESWAIQRYPLASRYDADKVREAVARHIPDELAKARIADLEAEIASLKQSLEWARR